MSGLITQLQQQWQSRSFANERDFITAVHQGLEGPTSQATSLFFEKIVAPSLAREAVCSVPKNYAEKLSNWMRLKPSVPSFLTSPDWDGDFSLSPIEIALYAYATEDALQKIVKPSPAHSIRLFIQNLSALEKERKVSQAHVTDSKIENLPLIVEQLLEGNLSFDPDTLASSAKKILGSLQVRLQLEPENRELWLASFQVWEVVLELSRLKSPENYLSLMKESVEYYESKHYAFRSEYLSLFYHLNSFRWISVQVADAGLQKKLHTHSLSSEDQKRAAQVFSLRVYHAHQLAELRVEGLKSHAFMIQNFGVHPQFFSEEVFTASICPHQETLSLSSGEDIPYNVGESFEKWCRCFCDSVFGQDSTLGSVALELSQNSAFEEWLQPYWERFMNDPHVFEKAWEEINDFAAGYEKYKWIARHPTLLKMGWDVYWRSQVTPEDWQEQIQLLNGKGVTLYAHRMGDREERRNQAYAKGHGIEVDVGLTRDKKWVVYHELQAPSGPYVIDLSLAQLEKEGVSSLETLRTGDHPLIIDDKTSNNSPHADLEGAAASLVSALKPVGNNILIDSVNPVFLADLKKEITTQNLPFKLAYLFMEYGLLQKFAEEIESQNESREFPFDTVMLYGKDLRRLQKEKKETLEILHLKFKIVIAEDDPRALDGLEFDGLIAGALPGISL